MLHFLATLFTTSLLIIFFYSLVALQNLCGFFLLFDKGNRERSNDTTQCNAEKRIETLLKMKRKGIIVTIILSVHMSMSMYVCFHWSHNIKLKEKRERGRELYRIKSNKMRKSRGLLIRLQRMITMMMMRMTRTIMIIAMFVDMIFSVCCFARSCHYCHTKKLPPPPLL